MDKKLSIVVPHYKEKWEVCETLFTSIAIQQGINLDAIEVIIVQDGEDGYEEIAKHLNDTFPYDISVQIAEHKGVSAARNVGLMSAKGDYVMFCDTDDMFLNNYGLYLVFAGMNEGYDAITSSFVEEKKEADGSYKIIRRDKDATFVHGKIYRRAFLLENELCFNEELTIHEDGYFNCLSLVCAEESKKNIETPFYLWKWNDNSTVRVNPDNYVLRTYSNLMDCRIALCEQLEKRGFINEFVDGVVKTVLDSYYDFNKPEYLDKNNAEYVKEAEKAFKRFYMKFKDTYNECATRRKGELAYVSRSNAFVHGLIMEQRTIKEWLTHIVNEVK